MDRAPWRAFTTWPRRVQVFKMADYWVWCCPCCGCFRHLADMPWIVAQQLGYDHAVNFHDNRNIEEVHA